MKKILIAVIVLALMSTCVGCGQVAPSALPEQPDIINQATAALERGDIRTAYAMLKEGNSKEVAKFAFVPVLVEDEFYRDEFTYDEQGNLAKRVLVERDSTNDTATTTETIYENGIESKKITTYPSQPAQTTVYERNDKDNIVKESISVDGSVDTAQTIYVYNDNDQLVRSEWCLFSGETSYINYEYDDQGRWIKIIRTDAKNVQTITEATYDSNGNMIRKTKTAPDHQQIQICTYDEQDRVIQYDNGDGGVSMFYYDEKGRCTRISGGKSERIITYDENDNVIDITYQTTQGVFMFRTTIQWELRYYADGVPDTIAQLRTSYNDPVLSFLEVN